MSPSILALVIGKWREYEERNLARHKHHSLIPCLSKSQWLAGGSTPAIADLDRLAEAVPETARIVSRRSQALRAAVVGNMANARSAQDIGALQTAAHGNARIGAHPHTRRRVQTCPPLRLQVLIACPIAEGAASEKQEIG